MPRATSEKVGRGPCPFKGCDSSVMFRRSSGGMLTCKCEDCDGSGYAPKGSERYTAWSKSITKPAQDIAPAAPAAPAKPTTPEPEAKPAPAVANSVFSLGNL